MNRIFLAAAIGFLVLAAHSEAQPDEANKAVVIKTISPSKSAESREICASIITTKNKVRRWKKELAAAGNTKGYGFAKLRSGFKHIGQTPPNLLLQCNTACRNMSHRGMAATMALAPTDIDNDDDGVNIDLSKKTSLSLDLYDAPDDTDIMDDDTVQDLDITVGLSVAIR